MCKNRPAAPAAADRQTLPNPSQRRTEKIRDLNDQFRQSLRGGRAVMTSGVDALGPDRVVRIIAKVRAFDTFTPDNDPYGEHDFGAFDEGGERFFWKIDYYDLTLSAGSSDPSDSGQTCRVLTVMLASEY